MITVSVEIGGTFTDLIMSKDGRIIKTAKVPSTPSSPDIGVMNALRAIGVPLSEVDIFLHGSTVATNAVLERKGVDTALLITEGFRDILDIQREERNTLYELRYVKPKAIIPRDCVFPVRERLNASGEVLLPLNLEHLKKVLDEVLIKRNIHSITVCLLHSYINPMHEKMVKQYVEKNYKNVYITISSEIVPEFREYERASTTALNAYVVPIMDKYIKKMQSMIENDGFKGSFRIVQSNGGILPAKHIVEQAVRTLLSGPAAGVIGATKSASNFKNLITLDMGGTSTDVCLVTDGKPHITSNGKIDSLPVRVPMIDINTVGAGGGSIARVEGGRLVQIGPQSAGAEPGPACYCKGGTLPTVTDANVVMNRIRPKHFLKGKMILSVDFAKTAVAKIADTLDISVEKAAESIVDVANVTMAHAVRLISVERGYDPRDYYIVAFGGAGPLHAVAIAEDLGTAGVIIPPNCGLLSSYGLMVADFKRDYVCTRIMPASQIDNKILYDSFEMLKNQALDEFKEYRMPEKGRRIEFSVDMRYEGQAFELQVPVVPENIGNMDISDVVRDFHDLHEMRYGHASRNEEVELVNCRLSVVVPQGEDFAASTPQSNGKLIEEMDTVYYKGERMTCRYIWRDTLYAGLKVDGPVVIEEECATSFVPPGWTATVDDANNIVVLRGEENE